MQRANVCHYKGHLLVEPKRESGVFALVTQLQILEPDLFPFHVLDYDTHAGIDVIVKGDKTTPIYLSKLFYVEFKHYLTQDFNHSFGNLFSIICWDTKLKHNDMLKDIGGEERKLQIIPPSKDGEYTKYFLDKPRSEHKIEVFVLKDYLSEELKMEFRPRTEKDSI